MSDQELVIRDLHAVPVAAPDQEILAGIDLTVRKGQVHAIMGPNGSGKTTLAYVLMGHPAYQVTRGSVTFKGKDILVGVIDVASDEVEKPEDIVATIEAAMKFVPKDKILACTNCGMAPMHRDIAIAKLNALGAGAALARKKLG